MCFFKIMFSLFKNWLSMKNSPKIPKQSFILKFKPWNLCWNEQEPKSLLRKSLKRLVLPIVKSKKGGILAEKHHVVSEVVGFNILAVVDNQSPSPSNVHRWKAKKPWKLTWKHHHQRTHSQDSQRISDSIFWQSYAIFPNICHRQGLTCHCRYHWGYPRNLVICHQNGLLCKFADTYIPTYLLYIYI